MERMHADFFTGTFYAMRTEYKKEYRLLKDEVADLMFECLFIIVVQAMLSILVLIYGDYWGKISFRNNF
jgi:hypothetical protein